MSGLYRYNSSTYEGKYLIQRRDGSIPEWPCIVLGARDPAAYVALMAYANEAEGLGYDPQFVVDIRRLAQEFEQYRTMFGRSEPDSYSCVSDDPEIVARMRLGNSA